VFPALASCSRLAAVATVPVSEESIGSASECDPSYPDLCIPPGSADLNCDYVYSSVTVYPPDPHGFDDNGDWVGCEG
jgi:micrococcal nuclease